MSEEEGTASLPRGGRRQISEDWDRASPGDLNCLEQALDTGLSGTAPMVDRYEQALASFYKVPHAVAISSGAAAVGVALTGFDWAPDDEVIVSPACPLCTVFPILMHGLQPVFCDVSKDSFGLDPDAVSAAITPRTRVIIEVPMWGYPTRCDNLKKVAGDRGIPLLLDLAHAHLVTLAGKYLVEYGDVACFSTHEGKYFSTGEGGFILTNDQKREERMRAYSRFGNLRGETVGLNFKLSGLQAALGLARLGILDAQFQARRENREYLKKGLTNLHVCEVPIVPCGKVSGYAMLLQAVGFDGRRLVNYLHENGIPSDIKKYDNRPLYEYPIIATYRRECPNAAALLRSLTTIPIHPDITRADLDYMVKVINSFVP